MRTAASDGDASLPWTQYASHTTAGPWRRFRPPSPRRDARIGQGQVLLADGVEVLEVLRRADRQRVKSFSLDTFCRRELRCNGRERPWPGRGRIARSRRGWKSPGPSRGRRPGRASGFSGRRRLPWRGASSRGLFEKLGDLDHRPGRIAGRKSGRPAKKSLLKKNSRRACPHLDCGKPGRAAGAPG